MQSMASLTLKLYFISAIARLMFSFSSGNHNWLVEVNRFLQITSQKSLIWIDSKMSVLNRWQMLMMTDNTIKKFYLKMSISSVSSYWNHISSKFKSLVSLKIQHSDCVTSFVLKKILTNDSFSLKYTANIVSLKMY